MNNQTVEVGQCWTNNSDFTAVVILKTTPKWVWTIDTQVGIDKFLETHTPLLTVNKSPQKIDIVSTNSLKNGTRPPKNGWAAGDYECICYSCKEHFVGDKRAMSCEACAYKHDDIVELLEARLEFMYKYRNTAVDDIKKTIGLWFDSTGKFIA